MIGGVELRRERALGDIVSDAFTILLGYWKQLAVIAIPGFAVSLAYAVVSFLVEDDLTLAILFGIISFPIQFIIFVLVGGGTVYYLDRTDRGETISPQDALDAAQAKLGVLVGATLRTVVICFLFAVTIIGIPLAIYRIIRWVFISQSVMLDNLEGEQVLANSASLVQGQWWLTLGRTVVTSLVVGLPAGLLGGLVAAAFPGVIGAVVQAATIFITVPYGIIATTLIFFDYKIRKGSDASTSPA